MKNNRRILRRIISTLLAVLMVISLVPMSVFSTFASESEVLSATIDTGAVVSISDADGNGYYDIDSADKLYAFAKLVNDGDRLINAELTDDIVVNENVLLEDGNLNTSASLRGFTPIGIMFESYYGGHFNGNNKTISGLYVDNTDSGYAGLFGSVKMSGVVENVIVKDSYFYGNNSGAIAGYSSSIIKNCHNYGTVAGALYLGGIVGEYTGDDITALSGCTNYGTIIGEQSNIGGIVGHCQNADITACANYGTVKGTSNVAGIAGSNDGGTFTNCYNTGDINSSIKAGGIAGGNSGVITNCYNTGAISATMRYAGGIAGEGSGGTITNSYSTGTINARVNFGAIVGTDYSIVTTNCYYLDTSCTKGSNNGNSAGYIESKTADEFSNGQVAYLLQGEQINEIWGQDLGTDTYPVIGGKKVYQIKTCQNEIIYSNTNGSEHSFDNGICSRCNAYTPATLNENNVYEISDAGQLYWFADKVNNDNVNFGSANAILTADIIVNEGVMTAESEGARVWTPIGVDITYNFGGDFDGNNHTISGIYFNNNEAEYVGLFGCMRGGTINNIGVINSYFCGNKYVGAIVGHATDSQMIMGIYNSSRIENSYNASVVNGKLYVGGIAGSIDGGKLTNCYNTGTVTGGTRVGGVSGNCGSMKNTGCYNKGTVNGESSVGGLFGYDSSGTTTNCYNTGAVNGESNIGGIIGETIMNSISACYNTGVVTGNINVGGVIGDKEMGGGSNCYYLDTVCNGGISGVDTVGFVEARTAEAFASGEVAYLLQGTQREEIWGQKLGTDTYPVIGGDKVYTSINCMGEIESYSNTEGETFDHNFENGFCTICDSFEPATDENNDGVYEIANAGQLYWFAEKVNEGNQSINAMLTADIVVNEDVVTAQDDVEYHWNPIGSDNQYTGVFDGNNHYISGLYSDSASGAVGLFSYIGKDGVVKNTGVINSYFYGENVIGSIAGGNEGTISDCYNTSIVWAENECAGGIVGENYGVVENCYNKGQIVASYHCGGIVGINYGVTRNCYNAGALMANKIIGDVVSEDVGEVTNCYYLSDKETDDIDGTTAKSLSAFASGEVAYLLGESFGQELTVQDFPVHSSEKVYYGYISCDENAVMVYTNNADASEEKPDHNWDNGACTVCNIECTHDWSYGICSICKMNCKHPECAATYTWDSYDDGVYVTIELHCVACGDYVDSDSGYAQLENEVEAKDCMNPGSQEYLFTYEYNGITYSDTETFVVKSDNHTGELVNGFCSDCGGYEPAKLNDNGTPDDEYDDYYEISNAGQLYWFKEVAVAKDNYSSAVLTADIIVNEDLSASDLREWDSIGESSSMPYCGVFNGQGHFISGLYTKSEYNYVGLFGAIGWGATISDLGVIDSYFEGGYYVGGIVGYSDYSYINNCYVDGVEIVCNSDGGAFVGYNYGEISNSFSTSDSFVGNNNYGTITNCYYLCDEETDYDDGTTAMSAEAFASGEVAYLLQAGVVGEDIYDDEWNYIETIIPEIWGQNLGTDEYPVLYGDKVYRGYADCEATQISYSNSKLHETMGHTGGTATCYAQAVCDYCSESYGDLLEHNISFIEGYCTNEGCPYKVPFYAERYMNWDDDYSYETYSFDTLNEAFDYATAVGSGYIPEQSSVTIQSDVVVSADVTADRFKFDFIVNEDVTLTIAENRTVDLSALDVSNIAIDGKIIVNGTLILPEGFDAVSIKDNLKGSSGTVYVGEKQYKFVAGILYCYDAHNFEDAICKDCGYECWHMRIVNGYCALCGEYFGADKVTGYTISLGDKISVNYYMQLSWSTIKDPDAKMIFTVPDSGSFYTVEIPVSEATKTEDGYYVFTCKVAAKEMSSVIKAQVVSSDSESDVFEYSVREYAEYILEQADKASAGGIVGGTDVGNSSNSESSNQYVKAAPLVKAMLNYGAYAQEYFGYNTDNLANASLDEMDKALVEELDLSEYSSVVSGEQEGVSFYGGVLSLKSETAIKLYFEVDSSIDIASLDITVDGKAATAVRNGKYYEITISDIPAHKLADIFEIKVNNLTVKYGAFSYGNIAMSTDKDELKNTIKAMYAYNQAASEYREG